MRRRLNVHYAVSSLSTRKHKLCSERACELLSGELAISPTIFILDHFQNAGKYATYTQQGNIWSASENNV
jgi:phosphoribosylaminoimidazole (AIR) synthetase